MRSFKALKSIVSIVFAMILSFSVTACNDYSGEPIEGDFEEIKDTDYSITFYWGPEYDDFTEEEVVRMKECCFDVATIYNFPWGGHQVATGEINYNHLAECAELLKKHGLNASVNDGRLMQCVTKDATREKIDKYVKRMASFWKGHDNVIDFYVADEPQADMAQTLKLAVEVMREYFPNCTTYINLLPNYATPEQLGGSLGAITYEEYVETIVGTVKPDYICTDYYAFLKTGRRDGYAENLEVLKAASEKYDIETRFIVLASEHIAYKNLSREEIAWQSNLSLLYGMKQLSWYTYAHPIGDPSSKNELVDQSGNATQHYYDVQDENKRNRVIGNALYDTNVEKVFYVGTEVPGLNEYKSYGKLKKISDANDMLISFYENDYIFMMSQYSEGTEASKLTADVISALQWCNPETNRWEGVASCPYVDGDTVSLTAGQGVLFRYSK